MSVKTHRNGASPRTPVIKDPLEQAQERLDAVLTISQALSSTHNPDELLSLIMNTITELMDADRSTLFLVNQKEGIIWSKILQGENVVQIRLPIGTGIAGWVAETGETVNIHDAYKDRRFHAHIDQKTGYQTQTILAMPLSNQRGRIIGVIQVLNKGGGEAFTADDEKLLEAITAQAAIFLENAQLYHTLWQKNIALLNTSEKLKQRTEELDLLYELEKQLSRSFDLDEMMGNVLMRLVQRMGCEAGAVALKREDIDMIEVFFHCSDPSGGKRLHHFDMPREQGFLGWSVSHQQPLVCNNPLEDERCSHALLERLNFEMDTVLCLPFEGEGKATGAIQLLNKVSGQGFNADDLKVLRVVTGQIRQAIKIGRQRERQEKQNRLASIGQLLSGLLHDLKTPMTLISGYAQMLTNQESPDLRRAFSEEIERQVERLNSMTREVLAFAKGESTILVRKINMNQFVSDIHKELEQEFKDYPIELEVDQRYRGPAMFDETKIQRLVFNMARNARQAMPEGGHFRLGVDADECNLHFTFSDSGTGIPLKIQSTIFDSFVTGRPSEGTGLGLAIVKKIVDEHDGQIRFHSQPGEGTTFYVTVPLSGPKREDGEMLSGSSFEALSSGSHSSISVSESLATPMPTLSTESSPSREQLASQPKKEWAE